MGGGGEFVCVWVGGGGGGYKQTHNRVSNHPDFVGIIQIFLENPESRHNLGRDRKNPDFEDLLPRATSPERYFRQILIILVIQGNEILNLDIQVKSKLPE